MRRASVTRRRRGCATRIVLRLGLTGRGRCLLTRSPRGGPRRGSSDAPELGAASAALGRQWSAAQRGRCDFFGARWQIWDEEHAAAVRADSNRDTHDGRAGHRWANDLAAFAPLGMYRNAVCTWPLDIAQKDVILRAARHDDGARTGHPVASYGRGGETGHRHRDEPVC